MFFEQSRVELELYFVPKTHNQILFMTEENYCERHVVGVVIKRKRDD
jgi:hypothetical protein